MAVRVESADPPLDTALVRLYYPASPTGSDRERLTGVLPPDRSAAPLPVVIMLPAVNVPSDTYRWLAVEIVRRGYAAVTYNHVGELMPGQSGLSPGIDLGALGPDDFGRRHSATALGPILDALRGLVARGTMEGMLDLSSVVLGGHSAGGTVALENADPAWFPGVRAVFSYGSHTVPVAALGHPAGTVLPVGPVPALVMAGAADGVIRASADRYGAALGAPGHSPVSATFEQGVREGRPAYEVVFAGANHLLVCDPEDPTSARGFLESAASEDPSASREELVGIVEAFLARHVGGDGSAEPLAVARSSALVASARAKGPGIG